MRSRKSWWRLISTHDASNIQDNAVHQYYRTAEGRKEGRKEGIDLDHSLEPALAHRASLKILEIWFSSQYQSNWLWSFHALMHGQRLGEEDYGGRRNRRSESESQKDLRRGKSTGRRRTVATAVNPNPLCNERDTCQRSSGEQIEWQGRTTTTITTT